MYKMYLGTMLCPITPSKIDVKIKGQNKTLTLINDVQVNVLKNSGLTEISFDLLLPNVKYPFAQYNIVWKDAQWYLNRLEMLKQRKKVFQWIVTRTLPDGKTLYDTNISVSLESYTIKEDAKQGFDVIVSVTLKQYREYGTKIVKVLTPGGTASVEKNRETANSPAPSENSVKTHTVTDTDTLWNIAKKYYGDGSKYTLIYEANKDKIANPSVISEGQVLTIPGIGTSSGNAPKGTPETENTTSTILSPSMARKTIKIICMNYLQVDANLRVHFVRNGKEQYKDISVSALSPSSNNVIDVDAGTEVLFAPSYKGTLGNYGQDGVETPVTCNNRRVSLVTVSKSKTGSQTKAKINVNATFDMYWNLYFSDKGGRGGKF